MKKKVLAVALSLAMAFGLAACGSSSSSSGASSSGAASTGSDEIEELTINFYNPVAGTVTDSSIEIFAQKVEKLSGGKMTVNITPAGTLGAEREATELLLSGDINMGVFSIDGLEWLVPDVGMYWVSLPGLLTSFEQVDEVYNNGWMFERHKEVAAEYGVDVICPGEFGLKVFLGTGDPIYTYEDFAGKKIRIPDVDMNHDYIQQLGALSISGVDMYTGLQQGTMDAVQNNIPASALFKLEEVIDWVTLTWDIYGTNYYIADKNWSDTLSDAQYAVIQEASEAGAAYIREQYRDVTETWVQECRDNPDIEVIDIDDEFREKLNEAAYAIWDEYRDKFDTVAMEKIFDEYYPN